MFSGSRYSLQRCIFAVLVLMEISMWGSLWVIDWLFWLLIAVSDGDTWPLNYGVLGARESSVPMIKNTWHELEYKTVSLTTYPSHHVCLLRRRQYLFLFATSIIWRGHYTSCSKWAWLFFVIEESLLDPLSWVWIRLNYSYMVSTFCSKIAEIRGTLNNTMQEYF